MEQTFYWELRYGDFKNPTTVMIPPAAVEVIKRRWEADQPIHLSTGSVPANQIRSFEMTDKPMATQHVLEDVAQAFKEPMYTEDGAIITRWVKQTVTHAKWDKHYSAIHSYRLLGESGAMAIIAFRKATHEIDQSVTPYCTDEEVNRLTK